MRTGAQRGQNILGAVLIALVILALGAFAFAAIWLRPPPTDAETLCRSDAPLAAHTIVLIDSTDRLERRHKRRLEAVVAQERARLKQYDRLTLMRIDSRRPREPRVLFSKCLPRPPELANPLFENPRIALERWNGAFADAMESAVRAGGAGRGANRSPILQSIRAIAADPGFGADIPSRRLVLVSDLLEHDPDGFSLYASDAAYAEWRTGDPTGPADLSEIDLRIAMLDRPDLATRQVHARDQFWTPYFEEAAPRSISFDPAP